MSTTITTPLILTALEKDIRKKKNIKKVEIGCGSVALLIGSLEAEHLRSHLRANKIRKRKRQQTMRLPGSIRLKGRDEKK